MCRCSTSGPSNRSGLVFFLECAALAAIVVGLGARSTFAVGLTYVDGLPGSSFGETPNLFRSNGTSLGTPGATDVFTSETNLNADNAWGWRDFGATNTIYDPTPGVVDLDYTSVYEAADEDAPEFQMRLTGANGIAASTAYDVYVAYWGDLATNWNIRAGIQPGTAQAPLQVFGNFNTTVAGEIPGTYASSAAWSVKPLDNPTDENNPGATDNNDNPFLDVTPGAPANSARNMLLGLVGTITSGSQPGAAANEIRVWIDDLPSAGNGGVNRRSWFDGLAFVPAGTNVFLTAEVDRNSGSLTVRNTTSDPFTVVSYSILSAAGALNGSGVNNAPWNNLTANTLSGYTDTDNDWAVVGTPSAFSTELREQDGGLPAGAQDGIVLPANNAIPVNLGGVWQRSPFEDIQVVLRLADGTPGTFDDNPTVIIFPTYSGDTLARGDFNGDGAINVMDYISLMQNLHKPQGTLTRTEYYRHGDINDNNVVNRDDYYLFRTAYFQANPGAGAGGFAAMVAEAAEILGRGAVPEPSTLWLAMLGGGLLCARSRRRSRVQVRHFNKDITSMNHRSWGLRRLGAVALVVGSVLASGAQAVPVVGWQKDALVNNGAPNAVLTNVNTNSPTIGNGTANNADDVCVWGATASNVHLDPNFEAILSGRLLFTGADPGNGRDLRWGMWKRIENGAPNPTGAWLGYMAEAGSGATPGRLEARNPDDPGFSTASFISNFGGASIATTSGPAPTTGSPLDSNNNVGAGTGRYFLLSEPPVTNNAVLNPNIWHTFEIRVGRYGEEVTVSGSLVADATPAVGDYNNNGTVDAADYTVWRNNLGGPGTALANRDPNNGTGPVAAADYNSWKANFGNARVTPYQLRLGGGLDFNGNPPPALDDMGNPVPYTPHLTFDFDRVGLLFGNQMNADQVQLQNVDISVAQIQTLDLFVNTTTGAVQIRNNLATPFQIDYYEITSTLGVLESDNWLSLDAANGGLPVTNDYLTGWDVAEGSSDFVLSEGNFVGFSTVTMGSPINLGNVFKASTPIGNRDIRFFAGVVGGGVIRGTVTYSPSGLGGLAVPEPAAAWLLLSAASLLAVAGRRCRSAWVW